MCINFLWRREIYMPDNSLHLAQTFSDLGDADDIL